MNALPLVLASRSPRRADLLRAAGIAFEHGAPPDVDETPPLGGLPGAMVEAIAVRKARAAAPSAPGRTVLTADTLVFADGEVIGKPTDAADARRMLAGLSGRTHQVCTGVAIAVADSTQVSVRSLHRCVVVTMAAWTPEQIADYVATREPLDKAGGYAIQGGAAAFASCLPSDRDTVIGLPIRALRALLAL